MNYRKERHELRMTTRELAKEAGVASSTISRLENGEAVYRSTARKVRQAIERLKNQYHPDIPIAIPEPKYCFGRGRRRPDIVEARRLLKWNQYQLAQEMKVDVHEISKIESGYATPDTAIEMQVETCLRERLKIKGMEWPEPKEEKEKLAKRDVLIIRHPNGKTQEVVPEKMWQPGPTVETAKMLEMLTDMLCSVCKGTRIVWNPNTGHPYKCPFCGV